MFEKQQLAFDKFSKIKVGALFMQMGTGKTRVALEIVNYNNVDLLIYVCPFSVKANILAEFEKWGVNCKYLIIGYESLQASEKTYLDTLEKMNNKKCFIIADESIFIKNDNTKRFERLSELRIKAEYALILNGTPITKNEWDLYNQMYFLSPLIINMNRQDFLTNFFNKIRCKKTGKQEKVYYEFSNVNLKLLNQMILPYIFEAELDFNMKESNDYRYIAHEDNDYYEEKEKFFEKIREQNTEPQVIINMLTSLNIIASTSLQKMQAVVNYIKEKQVIVYCNNIKEIEYIQSKIDCFVITGKVKNRTSIIQEFEKGAKPLIMTYGVGSYSLNLQFCNEIVYSSINFDYGMMEQSKYRIKRIGQNNDIKYTYILADLGITKMILSNLQKKQTLRNIIQKNINNITEYLKDII